MFGDVSVLLQSCNNRGAHAGGDPTFPAFRDVKRSVAGFVLAFEGAMAQPIGAEYTKLTIRA